MDSVIYKVLSLSEWKEAQQAGVLHGSPLDLKDGFIHLSSAEQTVATVQKYFAGREDLILIKVDATAFGDALRWETSRDGKLFPHLYAELPISTVLEAKPLRLKDDGTHDFPSELS